MAESRVVELPYDDAGLDRVVLPQKNLGRCYSVKAALHRPAGDVAATLLDALEQPIGTAPLHELILRRARRLSRTASAADTGPPGSSASACDRLRVTLIVDDLTRSTPVRQILPPLLKILHQVGVSHHNVTIVVALGTHRKMTPQELQRRLGEAVFSAYRVCNSHFDDQSMMVLMGRSADDVPIYIDRLVADADFRIGIGSIVPHGAVGWSGGGKILYPGVAGHETVKRFHYLHGLTRENMKGRMECSVRTTMEQWVETVGLDFIVNSVQDHEGNTCGLFAGHYVKAQREGSRVARQIYCHEREPACDVAIAVSHPHDLDFWQAAKGIFSAEQLTADGGDVVLVTPCPEGEGNHTRFLERCGDPHSHQLLQRVLRGEIPEPEDAVSIAPACLMHAIQQRVRVHLVSPNLDPRRVRDAGMFPHVSAQAALDHLLLQRPDARVSFVLHSDICFPLTCFPQTGVAERAATGSETGAAARRDAPQ